MLEPGGTPPRHFVAPNLPCCPHQAPGAVAGMSGLQTAATAMCSATQSHPPPTFKLQCPYNTSEVLLGAREDCNAPVPVNLVGVVRGHCWLLGAYLVLETSPIDGRLMARRARRSRKPTELSFAGSLHLSAAWHDWHGSCRRSAYLLCIAHRVHLRPSIGSPAACETLLLLGAASEAVRLHKHSEVRLTNTSERVLDASPGDAQLLPPAACR